MEDNIKNFLEKVQEFNTQTTTVFVPSLKKELKSQNLSFKQQKDIISTIGDGMVGALKFQKLLNELILENTENTDLLSTDRTSIVLKLRIDSIGGKLTKKDTTVDLLEIYEKFKKYVPKASKTIKGDVELTLEIPKASEENKIIKYAIDNTKTDDNSMSKSIGQIYTYEIIKYISKVKIGEVELEFANIPIKDRYKIVENLPLSTNKKVISYIQSIRKEEKELLTDSNGEEVQIDVSFFDTDD